MLQTVLNIAKNSAKRKNLFVIGKKVLTRIEERTNNAKEYDVLAWCKEHAEPYEPYLKKLDEELWVETSQVCKDIQTRANEKLSELGLDLGGGGNYPLLYFLVRYLRAKTIVETGVAAGWSSQAILTAVHANNNDGHLYSSDFPYFRQRDPEQLCGYIVDDVLKTYWTLLIDGDERNLLQIHDTIKQIDLFHYDSDKSYKGRDYAINLMKNKCHDKTIIIFDDIQDNFHFRDYVNRVQRPFHIFEFEGKYVGIVGLPAV